jgi:nucleotide-binding universal stress UspA family protein
MHATDFSPASAAAFAKALDLAVANRAELDLVHVLSPVIPMAPDLYVSPKVFVELEASAHAEARKRMAGLVARAKKRGVRRVGALLYEGLAHEQINRAARARRADVVVIGTHGRTGVARLFVGSVAGRVVASATRPVLTVRGR